MEAYEEWMEQAYRDMEAAKANFGIEQYYVSAFLSQQAAEKALKALMIKESGELRRIHDLVALGRYLEMPDSMLEMCAHLNAAYTATRYPDVSKNIDDSEAREMIEMAEEVLEWVEKRMS